MNEVGGAAANGLALLAGEAVWSGGESRPDSIERLTAAVELAALAAVTASLWMMASAHIPAGRLLGGSAVSTLRAPIVGTIALCAIASRPIRLLVGQPRREVAFWPSIAWRGGAAIVLAAALAVNAPEWGAALSFPLGIAAGAEAALAAWALGFPIEPRNWFVSWLGSALHLGAIGAMLAGLLQLGWDGRLTVVVLYLTLHAAIAIMVATAGILDAVRSDQLDEMRRQTEATIADEHRRRAHWLHDDVSSQLRIVSLRVQREDATPAEIVAMIDELDHSIRLRQLDEVMRSGTARLTEIIQPYVRTAQTHGVRISSVPSFDEASLVVDTSTARLVARATAVFTSNALNAGATEIGYGLSHDDRSVTVAVTDDAGGFDLADAPAGRGLWQLARELGPEHLTTRRSGRGTVVTATIQMEAGHDGDAVAGR
jgi:signal transduction histidine kinase